MKTINYFESSNKPSRPAFTLIELLVSIAIIAILASLLVLGLGIAVSKVKRMGCLNNLHQMAIAAAAYSSDDKRGCLSGTLSDGSDDVNWLYPRYVANASIFICPATRNFIQMDQGIDSERGLVDLSHIAANAGPFAGTSYEVFGFMGIGSGQFTTMGSFQTEGVLKTTITVANYRHVKDAFGLRGIRAGPSGIWLFLDADDVNHPNFPTTTGNHGSAGANVSFADGHQEWIATKRYVYAYELSQDEGRVRP